MLLTTAGGGLVRTLVGLVHVDDCLGVVEDEMCSVGVAEYRGVWMRKFELCRRRDVFWVVYI